MSIETIPSFVIKVLIVGRKDPIDSHSYSSREAAEADLLKINDARQGENEMQIPVADDAGRAGGCRVRRGSKHRIRLCLTRR